MLLVFGKKREFANNQVFYKSRDISKHFFPHLVNLALEGIYGRDGYNRSGGSVPVFSSLGVSIALPLLLEANIGY